MEYWKKRILANKQEIKQLKKLKNINSKGKKRISKLQQENKNILTNIKNTPKKITIF